MSCKKLRLKPRRIKIMLLVMVLPLLLVFMLSSVSAATLYFNATEHTISTTTITLSKTANLSSSTCSFVSTFQSELRTGGASVEEAIFSVFYNDGVISNHTTSFSSGTYANFSFTNTRPTAKVDKILLYTHSLSGAAEGRNRNFYIYGVNSSDCSGGVILPTNTSYETDSNTFSYSFFSGTDTIASPFLNYAGTNYTATSITSGNMTNMTATITLPLYTGTNPQMYFKFTRNGTASNGTVYEDNLNMITFGLCNATITNKYLNITFKNETLSQENVSASITSAFSYYLGSGSVFKSYSYQNLAATREYAYCFNPASKPLRGNVSLLYYNSESPQRNYAKSLFTYSNVTTNLSLFLLPTSQGIDVTFQVVSLSQSPIQGAIVNMTRSGYGLLESEITDSSGSATFFMNPLSTYIICAEATGYDVYCASVTPTQSSYTIQLGGSQAITPTNYLRSVDVTVYPLNATLMNDTTYAFALIIDSDYWALTEYGYVLKSANGTILGSASGSNSGGGTATANINVGSYDYVTMYYYWLTNGTYTNMTRSWVVLSTDGTQYSIANAINRFKFYTGNQSDSDGLFGLKTGGSGDFSMVVISFVVILLGTGVASYRYGISNPAVVMAIFTAFVYLFDVILDLIPEVSPVVQNLPTLIVALITVILIIREEII